MTNSTKPGQLETKQTLIEDETEFRGKLSSRCAIVVKGSVDGEIYGPSLTVSAGGTVIGQVKVGDLRCEGTIGGEVEAETVQLAGNVRDKTVIRARSLEVLLTPKEGRLEVTFGECELAVGDVPGKEAAVVSLLPSTDLIEAPPPPVRANRRSPSAVAASVGKSDDALVVKPVGNNEAIVAPALSAESENGAARRPPRDAANRTAD